MLEFNCPNRKFDGTPVVCDQQVMGYAEAQIADYDPELLRNPGKLDALHFVKSYLNAVVDVQNIRNMVQALQHHQVAYLFFRQYETACFFRTCIGPEPID